MIAMCPVCGKKFDVLWPQLWRYKRGQLFICSWKCLRLYDRKEETEMARMKKDGTPAMKPGPKAKKAEAPKPVSGGPWEKMETPEAAPAMVKVDGPLVIETPEAGKVKIVETPEKPKQIYNPVKYDGMVIREVEGLFGRYRRSDVGSAVYIDFENAERMDTLSFTAEQWRSFGKEFVKCARILGVEM